MIKNSIRVSAPNQVLLPTPMLTGISVMYMLLYMKCVHSLSHEVLHAMKDFM